MPLDPDKFYRTRDPDLLEVIPYSTAAHMRVEGRGPNYLKLGKGRSCRILYKGREVLAWLEGQTVRPGAAAG